MRKCLLFVFSFMFVSIVHAFTVTPIGTEAQVQYQEPNTNADGTPLNDLDHTTIYYSAGGNAPVELRKVPATSSNGNGQITETVVIPALDVPEGEETVVEVWATATDTSDNNSAPSEKASITVDRLSPAAPK